jgi:hypothetical protein
MKIIFVLAFLLASFSAQSRDLLRDRDIIGEWYTLSLNNGIYEKTDGEGRIRFYDNKTFQILAGRNSIVPGCDNDCTGVMGTWYLEEGLILMMQRDGFQTFQQIPTAPPSIQNPFTPFPQPIMPPPPPPPVTQPYLKGWGFLMINEGKYLTFTRAYNQVLMKRISR